MAENPIADAVTLRDNERKLHAQHVTAERQKWRDRIRELTIQTVNIAAQIRILSPNEVLKLHVIRSELKIRFNPDNKSDKKIIKQITQIIKYQNNYPKRLIHIDNFENEISWLLKEDWQRVKYETRPLWLLFYQEREVDRNAKKITKKPSGKFWKDVWKVASFFGTVLILGISLAFITYVTSRAYKISTEPDQPESKSISISVVPASVPYIPIINQCCTIRLAYEKSINPEIPLATLESPPILMPVTPVYVPFPSIIINKYEKIATRKSSVKRSKSKNLIIKNGRELNRYSIQNTTVIYFK